MHFCGPADPPNLSERLFGGVSFHAQQALHRGRLRPDFKNGFLHIALAGLVGDKHYRDPPVALLALLLHGRDAYAMVGEGLLAYTIPAMVNHPEQRYTVPSDRPVSDDSTA